MGIASLNPSHERSVVGAASGREWEGCRKPSRRSLLPQGKGAQPPRTRLRISWRSWASTVMVAIGLLMSALTLFMRETRHATAVLRIPETYLERERKL